MSRLVIVVGLSDNKPTATPSVVYIGRDASEALRAQAKSACPRFLLIPHATGIPKNNPNAAANAAALAATAAAEANQLAQLAAELASAKEVNIELSRANESLAAANAIAANELSTLRRQLDHLLADRPAGVTAEAAAAPEPAAEEPPTARRKK